MSRPIEIIGLTGNPNAGKDTVAITLNRNYGFRVVAFADALRLEIAESFGVGIWQFRDRQGKEAKLFSLALGMSHSSAFKERMSALGHDLSTSRSPRDVMRLWGTEFRRYDDPEYWVTQLEDQISELARSGRRRIVVTDVRFPNEAALIRRLGGEIWRVHRFHTLASSHLSDTAMGNERIDRDVHNEGTLLQLEHEVERLMTERATPVAG